MFVFIELFGIFWFVVEVEECDDFDEDGEDVGDEEY